MKGLTYKVTKQNEFKTEVAVIYKQNVILFLYIRQDDRGYYVAGGHADEYKQTDGYYKPFPSADDAVKAIKAVDYRKIETRTCVPVKDVKF